MFSISYLVLHKNINFNCWNTHLSNILCQGICLFFHSLTFLLERWVSAISLQTQASNLSTSYTSVIGQYGISTGFSGLQNHLEVLSIKHNQSIIRQYFQIFAQPHFVLVFPLCSQQTKHCQQGPFCRIN